MKYLSIKTDKSSARPISDIYKMLVIKNKQKQINKWRDMLHSQLRRFNIVKLSTLLQIVSFK